MSEQPKISLVMIAKDEEKTLPSCLESVQGAVDELVVVDTGSTDETPWIARSFGATVETFVQDGSFRFDLARNRAIDLATGDWCLSLDADERLLPMHWEKVRRICAEAPPQVLGCFIWCISPTPKGTDVSQVLRLFRRRPDVRFVGRIHEDIGPDILKAGGATAQTPIGIIHSGYESQAIQSKDKWTRNEAMLLLEDEERPEPLSAYNCGHHSLIIAELAKDAGETERDAEYREKAKHYFARALQTIDPSHMVFPRLLLECEMVGIKLSAFPGHSTMPLDPLSCGMEPDPLLRSA